VRSTTTHCEKRKCMQDDEGNHEVRIQEATRRGGRKKQRTELEIRSVALGPATDGG